MEKAKKTVLWLGIAAAFILLWRGQSRMKNALGELSLENGQLRAELAAARADLAKATTELDFYKTGDFSRQAAAAKTDPKPAPPPTSIVAEPETLRLLPPSVQSVDEGLVVRLSFESATAEPPDLVALVVRIPAGSGARIVKFDAADPAAFANAKGKTDASGTFAVIQGSPAASAVAFDLTVSGPVTATVRGSNGIKDFEIDIAPGQPAVRPIP